MIDQFGQDRAHVKVFHALEKKEEKMTEDTCGLSGLNSSEFVIPKSFSASRYRVVLLPDGHKLKMITCCVCGSEKPCEEFRTIASRRVFRGTCRECQNKQERLRKEKYKYRTIEQRKQWRLKHRGSALVSSARCRSRSKGIPFNLTAEYVQGIIDQGVCQMTGIRFDLENGLAWNSPSLDRIDTKKGYTKENVRVVLHCLNVMMNTWGLSRVLEIAKALRK